MKNNLDLEAISKLALEFSELYFRFINQFPKDMSNPELLKHLAASAIHMRIFMKEVFEHVEGKADNKEYDKIEKIFLDNCGCQINATENHKACEL